MQQPAAHAGLDLMTGIAGRRLLRLREQNLLMPDEERAKGLELIGEPAQPVNLNGAGTAGNLHNSLVGGYLAIEGRGAIEGAVTSYHRRLDHHPDVQFDHKRDHAGIGKVDLSNRTASFGKDIAKLQLNDFQMRCNGRKDV
jgi:hypothetical protein